MLISINANAREVPRHQKDKRSSALQFQNFMYKKRNIVAIAELSDGTFLMATHSVDVKVGGCGT